MGVSPTDGERGIGVEVRLVAAIGLCVRDGKDDCIFPETHVYMNERTNSGIQTILCIQSCAVGPSKNTPIP